MHRLFLVPTTLLLLANPVFAGEPTAEPTADHVIRHTLFAHVRGMKSSACETHAETELFVTLDGVHDVRADHETGWIAIELEAPATPPATDRRLTAEGAIDEIPDALEGAVRETLETGCGFELDALQTEAPAPEGRTTDPGQPSRDR